VGFIGGESVVKNERRDRQGFAKGAKGAKGAVAVFAFNFVAFAFRLLQKAIADRLV
jgi:hypothetical protein